MVVGIDDSEHSVYVCSGLWIISSLPSRPTPPFSTSSSSTPTSVVGLAGPGAAEVLPYVDSDLKKIVARVVDKAKQICNDHKSVKEAVFEVVEGMLLLAWLAR
ncbi:unnamed protein product [Linum tenue]|uniref:Uncharacterized protein n=1 Tax=Linum tenue TaxID=586396 RepID=A0AAV0H1D6_9ROSI|nr:unnamed protein product [Linum tenue]